MPREAVNNTLHSQPFKPFALRLVSQGGRTAVVNIEGEKLSIVDLGLVTTIELSSPNGH